MDAVTPRQIERILDRFFLRQIVWTPLAALRMDEVRPPATVEAFLHTTFKRFRERTSGVVEGINNIIKVL